MKLATLKDGSRDGQLVVVSQDLAQAHFASGIAGRLQQVLDDWNYLSPQLQELYQTLNHGKARHAFAFDPAQCMAPLPRAFRWMLCEPTAGGTTVSAWRHDAGDDFLGPHDDVPPPAGADALDCAAAWVAIMGDLPRDARFEQVLEGVRLLGLAGIWQAAAWRLPAFAPVVATPDELGAAWQNGRLALNIAAACNGQPCPAPPTGAARGPGPALAGTAPGQRWRAGAMAAIMAGPAAEASGLRLGDHLRLEARGPADGASPFGAIAQVVGQAGA